jgi:hypothetical protein
VAGIVRVSVIDFVCVSAVQDEAVRAILAESAALNKEITDLKE